MATAEPTSSRRDMMTSSCNKVSTRDDTLTLAINRAPITGAGCESCRVLMRY